MKVIHIIPSLYSGGAEDVLYKIITNDITNNHQVITFEKHGKYFDMLTSFGINIYVINFKSLNPNKNIFKFISIIKKEDPVIVQTWMYVGDIIGGIICYVCGIKKIFWNIRGTYGETKIHQKIILFFHKKLSRIIPHKIISCSTELIHYYISKKYPPNKFIYIQNGFDLYKFYPSNSLHSRFRVRNKFDSDVIVIGMVARYHVQKNHFVLIKCLKILIEKGYNLRLLLAGRNIDKNNSELVDYINNLNLRNIIYLFGEIYNTNILYNAIDFSILPSTHGEGFPNVIAESMLCQVPCIATNIGDSKIVIDNYGLIIDDPVIEKVCKSIEVFMNELKYNKPKWERRKIECRNHIVNNFSIEKMVDLYHNLWKN